MPKRRMKRIAVALLASCLCLAADVTGKWSGTLEFRGGGPPTPSVVLLKQDGQKVTGTGGPSDADQQPLEDGKIEGDKLTFRFQGVQVTLTVSGDRMEGEFSARRSEGPPMVAKLALKRAGDAPPVKNPFDTAEDAAKGRQYFLGHCAFCHGPAGEGGRGVNLTTGRYRHGGSDAELFRTIRRGVPGTEMPGSGLSENEVWRIAAYVRRLGAAGAAEKATGDLAAGRAVYQGKGGCAQCHVAQGSGGNLGPDLSEIGLRRSLQFLRESLTKPESVIADNHRTVTVVTRGGEQIAGIRLNEDDYSVQLRDTREQLRSFRKTAVREVKAESRSLMPAYGELLSARELDDLVAYLNSLRGTDEKKP